MEQTNNGGEAAKRPVFLTVLCILSFIASGFGIIGYLGLIAVAGVASSVSSGIENMEGMEGLSAVTSSGPSAGMTWAYIIIGFLTTIVSLFGVIKMWKLNKSGFMMYTGATVVSIIMSIVYYGFGPAIVGIIIGGAFIVMYGLNMKHLK